MTPHLRVAAVAEELNVSTDSVLRAIKRGALVAFKDGGNIRISRADLDAYVLAHKTGATPIRRRRSA